MPVIKRLYVAVLMFFSFSLSAQALGVLTHEAIVDAAWDKTILPLLHKKYPGLSAEQIVEAHAHAYGGAVAPDMGYYPAGSEFFTKLVHYVRSGEMVNTLLKEATNVNEFAFALGFLSHYNADRYGHPLATNKAVPLLYPAVQKKFGDNVTYADHELSHLRTEFGFDVLQVAKGNYVSQTYREFIGFKVDTAVLARAFAKVYGLSIHEVHDQHFFRSVETFRWVVANVFPLITRQAWATRKKSIRQNDSTATSRRFNFKMRQKVFAKNYGTGYKQPGFFPTIVSFFIRVLPKIGPLRPLKFKVPTPAAEKYFVESFDTIVHYYVKDLQQLSGEGPAKADIDYDTGKPTELCEYSLADETYAALLVALKAKDLALMPPALRADIKKFYTGVNDPGPAHCAAFWSALTELRK